MIGRIPGFTDAIFPQDSLANLNNVANLGLILFLFIIGLEVDLRYFFSNWKIALSVGVAGMLLPFGMGCAISYGLYHQFENEAGTVPIAYGTYVRLRLVCPQSRLLLTVRAMLLDAIHWSCYGYHSKLRELRKNE